MKNFVILIIAILLTACGSGDSTFKPTITGRAGEILIVINDDVKNDTSGILLHEILTEPYVGLPSDEPIFDVQTVPQGYFDKNMHTFRNIIVVEVNDTIKSEKFQFFNDVWAEQQAVVNASFKNKQNLLSAIDENAIKIISFFVKSERDRLIRFNTRTQHIPLCQKLEKDWNIDLIVPNTFSECKSPDPQHCGWFSIDSDEFQAGIFVYQYTYTDEKCLEKEYIISKRDSILGANAEGPNGSHMITETRFGMDEIVGKYTNKPLITNELRGLWRMDSYAMGGPFLLRAYYDEQRNRVVVLDGYIYYPAKDRKRNLIRQLEAVMYTLKFKETKE